MTDAMKKYYPVMLDINNKACVVVGGGLIGYRKTLSLIQYGASVTVISPDLCKEIQDLVNSDKILWINDYYKSDYLKNIFIVFAATNDENVNQKIYNDSKNQNILTNVVDVPELCDFIMPAVMQQGDLTIAVSTNGKSPTLAKKICEDLNRNFDVNYAIFLDILGEMREKVLKNIANQAERASFLKKIVDSDYLEKLKYLSPETVKQEIDTVLEQFGGVEDEK
jgi:precorrin-2 dehydrogenase/sirohydrochlorin ferrochelatase